MKQEQEKPEKQEFEKEKEPERKRNGNPEWDDPDRSISSAVAKMAIPSVISSLVTVVYNMADS